MAIGLEDLNCNQIKNQKMPHQDKERVLRPWEGYEKLGNQTRTITAREAVKKARLIVDKNENMAKELRVDRVPQKVINDLENKMLKKEEQFFISEEKTINFEKIKNKKTLVRFIKGLFQ